MSSLIRAKFIGIGAAGNKAAVELLKQNVVENPNDVLLLNTTLRDIPEEYREKAIMFGNIHGCGKERELGKKMVALAINDKKIDLDTFLKDEPDTVVIVTSVEGGTGSGGSINVARYVNEYLGINVHMFAFCGFESDVRGLKNTIDWFNDLSDKYVVEAISNKKFLSEDGDREQAEEAANNEFIKRMKILMGQDIEASNNNIDERDLFKVATQSGYMTIETCQLGKLRGKDQFNNILQETIDNSKSIDTEQSAIRMGVIINTSTKAAGVIDESFSVLKKHYGNPFETFYHRQYNQDNDYANIIVSGMKLPIDYIKKVYDNYQKEWNSVDKRKDSFFTKNDMFNTSEGTMFDMSTNDVITEDDKRQVSKRELFMQSIGIIPKKVSTEETLAEKHISYVKDNL